MPLQALSKVFLRLLCQEIERELYRLAFGELREDEEDSLAPFASISVDLAKKPNQFTNACAVSSKLRLTFAGEVSAKRSKPSFQVCTVLAGHHIIPIWVSGASLKTFAGNSEGCFVVPWMIPATACHTSPTLYVQLTEHRFELPPHVLAPCPKHLRKEVPTTINLRVRALVPASAVVGKTNVLLTQPELIEEVLPDHMKNNGPIDKSLGPQHILNNLHKDVALSATIKGVKSDASNAHLLK